MANTAGSLYTYINSAATTSIGPVAGVGGGRRINLLSLQINKTLTGTMIVRSGVTTISSYAIGTIPSTFWWTSEGGTEVFDLQIVTSAADDITVFWNNL